MEDKDRLFSGYMKGYRKALSDVQDIFGLCHNDFKYHKVYNSKIIPVLLSELAKNWEILCEYGAMGTDVYFFPDSKCFKIFPKGETPDTWRPIN